MMDCYILISHLVISPDKQNNECKVEYLLIHLSVDIFVLDAQKNFLNDTVLFSTHNIFWLRNKKINFQSHTLIFRPVQWSLEGFFVSS